MCSQEYLENRCYDLDGLVFEIINRCIEPNKVMKSTIIALWNTAGEPESEIVDMYPPEDCPGLADALMAMDWGAVFRYFQAEQIKAPYSETWARSALIHQGGAKNVTTGV